MATLLADANAADPALGGSSFIFEATQQPAPPSNPGSTVLVPFVSDWGPDGQVVPFDTYADYVNGSEKNGVKYGGFSAADTPGRRAVLGAFLGEGLAGRGGAGKVLGYRLCSASGAKATKTLQNTTPTNALTLAARYKGARGNDYDFTVRPAGGGNNELVVLDPAGRESEVYLHVSTDIAGLAAAINANPGRAFDATSLVTGVALAAITGTPALGGNSGTAYTSGDYTAMLAALEYEPFTVFAAYDLTDPTIAAALVAWKRDVKTRGKQVFLVLGGAAAEAFSAHKTRAAGYGDEDVLAFGTGSISDTTLTPDGTAVTISTAQGTARVAGAVARRGPSLDMVNVRFAGWTIVGGANRAQAEQAVGAGMTLLVRDGDDEAPTKIQLGVTSYTGNTEAKPFRFYSNVKIVRTLHALEDALIGDQEGGGDELIDGRGLDPKQRDIVKGRAQSVVKSFLVAGLLQPGSTVDFDPSRPYSEQDTTVPLVYDAVVVRGLRGIRNRIRVA